MKSGQQTAGSTLEMLHVISPIENLSVMTFDTLLSEGRRDREG